MKKKLILVGLIVSCMAVNPVKAGEQYTGDDDKIYNGGVLPTYVCLGFSSNLKKRQFFKRAKMVLKVWPYANVAGNRLQVAENELAKMNIEQRKVNTNKYYKIAENEIKAEFDKDMRKLSSREGQILIKLIDRQCNRTGYGLIKDLRNGFTAWSYNQFAKIFCGTNLKRKYDPYGEDEDIEFILEYYNLI
tara:strand:- start:421 stop:990 length:570 start_codon:yes stop_codon:yes gene_type:complete